MRDPDVDAGPAVGPEASIRLARRVLADPGDVLRTRAWDVDEVSVPVGHHVLWGHPPGRDPGLLVRAVRRRRAIRALRRGDRGLAAVAVLRVRAPGVHPPGATEWLRRAVVDGVWVHARRPDAPASPLDRIHRELRLEVVGPPRLVTGGGVLQAVVTGDVPALLRVGVAGTGADPSAAVDVLEVLAPVPGVPAPRLLGHGELDDLAWTLEEQLPGHAPRRLSRSVVHDVVAALGAMPVGTRPASVRPTASALARVLPGRAGRLDDVATAVDAALAGLPAVRAHGDLWLRNLLVHGGRLSGIVDWDGSRPDGVPGVDLLHLVATDLRARRREGLGRVWSRRPWDARRFVDGLAGAWPADAPAPRAVVREAIGVAWWLEAVAGTVGRVPARARDPRWLADEVDAVLARVTT